MGAAGNTIVALLKLLFYGVILAGLAYAAYRYRDDLIRGWQSLLKDLRELWNRWFGRTSEPATAFQPTDYSQSKPQRSFASYPNPFSSGKAAQAQLADLVRYTFEATEAWAADQGQPRADEQTPLEFALRLSACGLGNDDIRSLAEFYTQLAYSTLSLPTEARQVVARVWGHLTTNSREPRLA